MSETLKPCPRCQKADRLAFVEVCGEGGWGVACHDCHLTLDTRAETQAYAAIEWNRGSPAGVGEVEPVAWLKTWSDECGRPRSRVDRNVEVEPWLSQLKPTTTPLYAAPPPAWKPDREAAYAAILGALFGPFDRVSNSTDAKLWAAADAILALQPEEK